jgi:YcxB-like protein
VATGPSVSDAAITVRFQPTEADHYRASRDAGARNPLLRVMLGLLAVAPVLLIGLTVRAGFTLPEAIFRNVFPILLPIVFWIVLPLSRRMAARAVMRKAAAAGLGEVVMRFDHQGVRFGSPTESTVRWSDIRRAVETRHSMLLFVTWRAAAFFPVAAAERDGTLESLRELMRRHLGQRAEVRSAY